MATAPQRRLARSSIVRYPVQLPGLAAIGGKRLLEMNRILRDVRDDKSHQNCAPVERFLIIELPAAILEFTDRRNRHCPGSAVREIETPLMGFGIVESQAQRDDVAR